MGQEQSSRARITDMIGHGDGPIIMEIIQNGKTLHISPNCPDLVIQHLSAVWAGDCVIKHLEDENTKGVIKIIFGQSKHGYMGEMAMMISLIHTMKVLGYDFSQYKPGHPNQNDNFSGFLIFVKPATYIGGTSFTSS